MHGIFEARPQTLVLNVELVEKTVQHCLVYRVFSLWELLAECERL